MKIPGHHADFLIQAWPFKVKNILDRNVYSLSGTVRGCNTGFGLEFIEKSGQPRPDYTSHKSQRKRPQKIS